MKTLVRFLAATSGATAVEYGLVVTLIAAGMLVGLGGFSDTLQSMFEMLGNTIRDGHN